MPDKVKANLLIKVFDDDAAKSKAKDVRRKMKGAKLVRRRKGEVPVVDIELDEDKGPPPKRKKKKRAAPKKRTKAEAVARAKDFEQRVRDELEQKQPTEPKPTKKKAGKR